MEFLIQSLFPTIPPAQNQFLIINYINMPEERAFNPESIYTKLEDGKFRVERDQHASSDITPLEQFKQLANVMNQIKWLITQAKNAQLQVGQFVDWYNQRVEIMNNAKEKCDLNYKKLEAIDPEVLKNLIDCDVEKLPTIDIEPEEK